MRTYEGERIRLGYGFAWRNYEDRSSTTFLVPFNLILRCVRKFYFYLAKPKYTKKDWIYEEGYQQGKKTTEDYYERKIERLNNKWSTTIGKAILQARLFYRKEQGVNH